MLAFVAAERREFDGVLRKADRVTKLDWPLRFARTLEAIGPVSEIPLADKLAWSWLMIRLNRS